MTPPRDDPSPAEVRELAQSLCDGTLSPPEMDRLDRLLVESPSAREAFREVIETHAALEAHFTPQARPRRVRLPSRWACAAAVLLAALPALGWWLTRTGREPPPAPRAEEAVGELTVGPGCSWQGRAPAPGPVLAGQSLDLLRGTVEVHYSDGTYLVLEGPARACLVSPTAVDLAHGRARVAVPPARSGFTIKTAGASVTESDTEFEVTAAGGKTDLAVYRGLVECLALDRRGDVRERASVAGGQGATIEGGRAELWPFSPTNDHARRRYGDCPGLWAYWRFEDEVGPPDDPIVTQRAVLSDSSGGGQRLDFWPGGPEGVGRYRYSLDVPPAALFRPGLSGGRRSFDCAALPADAPGVLSCARAGTPAVLERGFTVEAFFKTLGDQSLAGPQAILYQGEKYHSYLIGLNRAGPGALAAQIVGSNASKLTRITALLDQENFASARWYYVALRYSPPAGKVPGALRLDALREDGQSFSTSAEVPPGFQLACSARSLLFGRTRFYRHEEPKQHFQGLIDEVRLSSAVLNEQQLLARVAARDE